MADETLVVELCGDSSHMIYQSKRAVQLRHKGRVVARADLCMGSE